MPKVEYPGWTSQSKAFDTGTGESLPRLVFDGISTGERVRWRSIIVMLYSSLPEQERRVVPPFHLYRTLLKAMNETFDCDLRRFDDAAEEYLREKVWAFAFMDGEELRNTRLSASDYRRIVLMVDRTGMVPESMPMEFTIFHEIGHFVVRFIHGVKMTRRNELDVEYAADEFGFKAYLRLLHAFPRYRTASPARKQVEFEDFLRGTAYRGAKKARGAIDDSLFERLAKALMEEMGWRKMYEQMSARKASTASSGSAGASRKSAW